MCFSTDLETMHLDMETTNEKYKKKLALPKPAALEFLLLNPTGYATDCEFRLLAMTVRAGA